MVVFAHYAVGVPESEIDCRAPFQGVACVVKRVDPCVGKAGPFQGGCVGGVAGLHHPVGVRVIAIPGVFGVVV